MNKVLGMHTLDLKPGCSAEEFEEFVKRDILPMYHKVPGQNARLLKGDRGERSGKYMLMVELESVQRRDEIYPSEGLIADDVQQALGNIDALLATFSSFVDQFPDPKYTDYIMVSD